MIRRLFYRGRHRVVPDSVLVVEVATKLRREALEAALGSVMISSVPAVNLTSIHRNVLEQMSNP